MSKEHLRPWGKTHVNGTSQTIEASGATEPESHDVSVLTEMSGMRTKHVSYCAGETKHSVLSYHFKTIIILSHSKVKQDSVKKKVLLANVR